MWGGVRRPGASRLSSPLPKTKHSFVGSDGGGHAEVSPRDLGELYGFAVRASLDPVDGEVDAPAALALYRIVQEAVTNAMKHARVDGATVTLRSAGEVVIAEIRDEGRGFELPDSGAEPDRSHVGLVAMRERAALVGGDVTVDTSPGKGTLVRALVPIVGPENRGEVERW